MRGRKLRRGIVGRRCGKSPSSVVISFYNSQAAEVSSILARSTVTGAMGPTTSPTTTGSARPALRWSSSRRWTRILRTTGAPRRRSPAKETNAKQNSKILVSIIPERSSASIVMGPTRSSSSDSCVENHLVLSSSFQLYTGRRGQAEPRRGLAHQGQGRRPEPFP